MSIEQGETYDVRRERKRPDGAHRLDVRHDGIKDLVHGFGQNGDSKREHERAFRQRSPRLPPKRPRQHEQAESVHECVADHVERVGEQRCGMSQDARDTLDHEHQRVNRQDYPQHAAVAFAKGGDLAVLVFATASHMPDFMPSTVTEH